MAGFIPNDVIEDIRQRVSLVAIVGEVTPLRRAGKSFLGSCPFHDEKSPSFTVSEEKQLYYCFGCGAGGSVFTFMMQYHRLNFQESLEQLARRAGVELANYPTNSIAAQKRWQERKDMLEILSYAAQRYQQALFHQQVGRDARAYLRERGFTLSIIKTWGLGFAPDAWDHLVRAMDRDNKSPEIARKAGLIQNKANGDYYDVFRGRIMFPIWNAQGQVVAFGGRVMSNEQQPKYLNTGETPLFYKGQMLYGLHLAANAMQKQRSVIVVEGYTDHIALTSHGFPDVVATLGTALTEDHGRLLKRYVDTVILLFDGDHAGSEAIVRAMIPLLSQGLHVRAVFLSEGNDPDSYVRSQGSDVLREQIDQAPSLLAHFIQRHYLQENNLAEKHRAIEKLTGLISHTKDTLIKEALLHEIVKLSKLDVEIFQMQQPLHRPAARSRSPKEEVAEGKQDKAGQEEFLLLRIASEAPAAAALWQEEEVTRYLNPQLVQLGRIWLAQIDDVRSTAPLSARVDAWTDEVTRAELTKAFLEELPDLANAWQRIWQDCLQKLKQKKVVQLSKQLAQAESDGKDDVVKQLALEMQSLKTQVMKGAIHHG